MSLRKEIPTGRSAIIRLAEKGIFNSRQMQEALVQAGVIPDVAFWKKFITISLLSLGVVFFLSGVIFFFAFNWHLLHKFMKLGSIAAVFCLSIAVGFIKGHSTLVGRLSWIAASVMIGVYLAVFGQIYQTGADAWQLFALWALLMAGWAILSIYAPHWTLFLVIVETATVLAVVQLGDHYGRYIKASIAIAAINSALYVLFELLRNRFKPWFDVQWFIRLVATAAVAGYLIPISSYIFELRKTAAYDIFPGFVVVLLLLFLASLLLSIRKSRDLYILSVTIFSLIVYGADFFINAFNVIKADSFISWIWLGLFIVILAVGAVFIIKKATEFWAQQETVDENN